MENNNETIKLIFPSEEENITWTKRKPRLSIDKKKSVNITGKISKLDLDPNVKASIKTDCIFCKKMIETFEYVKHLQEEHPLEYQVMCNRTKFKIIKKTIIPRETGVKKIPSQNPNNGKTPRGIEIQKILSNIQEKTKRKDLNPIEKENLQNTLLSLQKEMTDEIEKFSKYDSIPVRLDQVSNYLERLKEKKQPVKKISETPKLTVQSKIEETNKNKKEKMKVIWKFGL